jgi:nucleotide-binding universal stress UspA family protein
MRILLAVDGSRSSDRALDLVAALPALEGSRVRIVSVVPTIADPVGIAWAPVFEREPAPVDERALRTHREALDAAEREIRSARSDLTIETILLRGRPASRIVDEACSMPADLVVVGHRGHGTWESILLGSVSAEVVDHAPCPVLVARDERIGPIILADDRSVHARAAEAFMTGWPLFGGLPVTVVTVDEDGFAYTASVPPLVYSEAMDAYAYGTAAQRRATEADCEATAMRLRQAGLQADAEVREGDPAHEIVLSARQHGAGLVVVGTRGQTGLRRLILGSVARKVLLHAPCSVLIVRGSHVSEPDAAAGQPAELVSPFG